MMRASAKLVLRHRRYSWILGIIFLCFGFLASLIVIRGVETLKSPPPANGQQLIRHMRYTYAEIARVETFLESLKFNPSSVDAHRMLSDTADHLYVRLEMLRGLARGPMADPLSNVSGLTDTLMTGLDKLVKAGRPIDVGTVDELRVVSSRLLREIGDFTRSVEAEIDTLYRQQIEQSAKARYEVVGGVALLLVLTSISLGLFYRNRLVMEELRKANGRDSLTGLANRRGFAEWAHELEARPAPRPHALMVFDLDRFKAANDRFGHAAGDAALVSVADWLVAEFAGRGIVARWGGDEFVVAAELCPDDPAALDTLLARSISEPTVVEFQGEAVAVGVSCGVAMWPADGATIDDVMTNADAALYEAKDAGRGRLVFYDAAMAGRRSRSEALSRRLESAIAGRELFLEFQPQLRISDGRLVGAEALVRWRCGETGRVIPPDEFIPVAEESGQISQIDRFVLDEACRMAKDLARDPDGPLRIAVNISPQSFRRVDLVDQVAEALRLTGLPSRLLEVEITERLLLSDCDQVMSNLAKLAELGVRLALDDFGTGYSNIAYLARLKPDVLKIDRSFLREGDEHTRRSIVTGIVRLAETLGAETVVEGVETEDDLSFAAEAGCPLAQGFHIGRPMVGDLLFEFRRSFVYASDDDGQVLRLNSHT
ncbi:putative bifunctional diguanylate cyclase/phosphodiesterase [Stappia sp. ICDLI1TA098]